MMSQVSPITSVIVEVFCRMVETVVAVSASTSFQKSQWLRGEESNLYLQGENLASYLYSHPALCNTRSERR